MSQGMLRGGSPLAVFGVLLIFVLAFGALVSCVSFEDEGAQKDETTQEATQEPTQEVAREPVEKAGIESVVVRVSGTEGTPYQGTYETFIGGETLRTHTVGESIRPEPTDYEIEGAGTFDLLRADFQKTSPGGGILMVEILANGEVVEVGSTSEEGGRVRLDWALPE